MFGPWPPKQGANLILGSSPPEQPLQVQCHQPIAAFLEGVGQDRENVPQGEQTEGRKPKASDGQPGVAGIGLGLALSRDP